MLSAVAAPADLACLRRSEFARLEASGHVYLDYTGSALYGTSQLRAHHALMESGIFGNPHSDSEASRASTERIEAARQLVLDFFSVDSSTHEVIFTTNASAAIKLVAESYPFNERTRCLLAQDNHNSVNGIREYARRAGTRVRYLTLDADLRLKDPASILHEERTLDGGLLAFPVQSNFSGVQHPLALAAVAESCGYDVLLDAAAFVPSHALDLRKCPAAFTAISFYKLFGYPTGLGALIARRDALARLGRPWFAGGTVTWVSVAGDRHRQLPGAQGFEDGTPDFLGIAALALGFALLKATGMDALTAHVRSLTALLLEGLGRLRHADGTPLIRLYGPDNMQARGGTVAFNVMAPSGAAIPYGIVEEAARRERISLRGGCFCNPGASEAAFALDPATTGRCLDQLGDSFTPQRFAECTGSTVGAVRISTGLANNSDDIARVVTFLGRFASWRFNP